MMLPDTFYMAYAMAAGIRPTPILLLKRTKIQQFGPRNYFLKYQNRSYQVAIEHEIYQPSFITRVSGNCTVSLLDNSVV